MDEVAHRLRQAREARGFTQAEFARLLNKSPQSYNTWEVGAAFPNSLAYVRKICDLLGISADWLLFGDAANLRPDVYELLYKKRKR